MALTERVGRGFVLPVLRLFGRDVDMATRTGDRAAMVLVLAIRLRTSVPGPDGKSLNIPGKSELPGNVGASAYAL